MELIQNFGFQFLDEAKSDRMCLILDHYKKVGRRKIRYNNYMAEKPGAKPAKLGFHAEFGWFIWGFVILGVLWFFSGGIYRESSHEGA